MTAYAEMPYLSAASSGLKLDNDKHLILTDDQTTGNINRLIEMHCATDVARPAVSWIDHTGLHVGALHYHHKLVDSLGGNVLKQFEIKTIADQAGPNPTDQRTRFTVGTQAQRVKVGVVYSDVFEHYQGENPFTVGEGAAASFGLSLRTDPQDTVAAGASNFEIASFKAQIDSTDNTFLYIDANAPYSSGGTLYPGNKGVQVVFFRNTNVSSGSNPTLRLKKGDGTNTDAVVIIAKTGSISTIGPLGINGAAPPAKPTVTGAKGGNAALASLLSALVSYGFITDTTTA